MKPNLPEKNSPFVTYRDVLLYLQCIEYLVFTTLVGSCMSRESLSSSIALSQFKVDKKSRNSIFSGTFLPPVIIIRLIFFLLSL